MFALLLNLWMCTNLDRFRMCYSKAVARMSRVVNKWLETSGRCMKTIYFHGDRLRDGNSSVMLSVAYAVWLHCCFPKNPLICFLFVAVILSSVSSSCQSGMVGLIFTSFLNFLFFFKVPVRESSVNLAVILWESCRERGGSEISQLPCPLVCQFAGLMSLGSLGFSSNSCSHMRKV